MALRLEVEIDKKKEPTPVLDLSKFRMSTRQDFDKALDKVPDYKMKAERIRKDDMKLQEYHFTFAPTRAELLAAKEAAGGAGHIGSAEFPFGNPIPVSMQSVRIEDLSSVDINWRMLTLARPKTKLEEEIFTRYVSLDKLKRKTRQAEGDQVPPQKQLVQGKGSKQGKTSKGRARSSGAGGAVPEMRFPVCKDCGEELCSGGCKEFHYEASERVPLEDKEKDGDKQEGSNLSALLDGSGSASSRKKKAQNSSKGGPPRMSHLRRKRKKKKKDPGDASTKPGIDEEDEPAVTMNQSASIYDASKAAAEKLSEGKDPRSSNKRQTKGAKKISV